MEILQVPAMINKVQTMSNRSLRIEVDTQENLTDEEVGKITAYHEKLGWFNFSPETTPIKPEDLIKLPKIEKDEDEKSPSQRLRSRMYVYYIKIKNKGEKGFNEWYSKTLDNFGNKFLEKI